MILVTSPMVSLTMFISWLASSRIEVLRSIKANS
jgi:hypothetical protein